MSDMFHVPVVHCGAEMDNFKSAIFLPVILPNAGRRL